MAFNEQLAARVRAVLSGRTDVEEKKMFGGLCFMVAGSMCCGLTSTTFMVRVGPQKFADALAQPHTRPMDFTGKPLKGYVYVDAAGLKTAGALQKWIERGVDFVTTLPPKTPKKKKPARN